MIWSNNSKLVKRWRYFLLQILLVTAPIYVLMGVGFATVRLAWFSKADLQVLGRLVINVLSPALLFGALAQQDVAGVLNVAYLLVYGLGSLLALAIAMFVSHRVRGKPLTVAALQGMGSACSNSVFVGYPVLQPLLGPLGGVALAMTVLVENLLVLPLCLALADAGQGNAVSARAAVSRTLAGLVRNPMLVAIAAGFTCALLGWHLPPMLQKPLSMLGAAAGPVALFVVGGSLVGLTLDGLRTALAVVTTSKLVLHPLAVAGVLWAWSALVGAAGLPAGWALDGPLSFAVVAFAAMPMLGIYPVLALKYGEVRFASAVLLVTTLASFVTLTAWLWALGLTTMN